MSLYQSQSVLSSLYQLIENKVSTISWKTDFEQSKHYLNFVILHDQLSSFYAIKRANQFEELAVSVIWTQYITHSYF